MVPDPMRPGRGRQGRQFGNAVLGLEDDGLGSVAPRAFQAVQQPAGRQFRQALSGHRGPARVPAQSFQTHATARGHTHVRVDAEARDHRAPGSRERTRIRVDPIAQTRQPLAGARTDRDLPPDGVSQQGGRAGVVPAMAIRPRC